MEKYELDLNKKIESEDNKIINIKNKKQKKQFIVYWDNKSKNSLTNDYSLVDKIFYQFKICCYGMGTPRNSRRQNKCLIKPFVLNCNDTLFLYDK